MPNIGNLIYRLRKEKHMSRASLARGICSEKTVYFIEKEERTPSTKILNMLGERLCVELYEYLPYIEYQEPEKVKKMMDDIENTRNSDHCEELSLLIEEAVKLIDFSSEELMAELRYDTLF